MPRFAALVLGAAFACGACGQSPVTGNQPGGASNPPPAPGAATLPAVGAGDLRFTITFTFDNRANEPDTWTKGAFTTTGSLSPALIASMTATRGYIGFTWPSSGSQDFGDWKCETPDQCLEKCVGSYDGEWEDQPQIARLEQSGGHVVLDALLHPDPKAIDDAYLTTPNCPPTTNNGLEGFPPMHITIDGLGGGATPTYAAEPYAFEGTGGPMPGDIWHLEIAPIP